MVNVTIYSIHVSYGWWDVMDMTQFQVESPAVSLHRGPISPPWPPPLPPSPQPLGPASRRRRVTWAWRVWRRWRLLGGGWSRGKMLDVWWVKHQFHHVSPCFTINLSGINRINIWFSRDTILYLYDVISNLNSAKLRVCLFWAIPDFQMTRSIGIGLSYFQINQTNKTGWWFQTWRLFPIIHGIILPIHELIFFRGVGQPPTRKAKHIIILLRMIPTTKK